jgi:GH15 family glucan-1,4-alpha-glucosidase
MRVPLTTCVGKCSLLFLSFEPLTHIHARPQFDSPSVFCRILDANKGGYFRLAPTENGLIKYTTKQAYAPSSNIIVTKWISECGALEVIDFFPRPLKNTVISTTRSGTFRAGIKVDDELKKWLVRRAECTRGCVDVGE